MPPPVKVQDKTVDMKLDWPATGKAIYLDGKLEGIMIRVKPGETAKAIAAGTVVSAGPSRGFNQVAFVQAKTGYVYVYGGNDALFVKTGDQVGSGKEIRLAHSLLLRVPQRPADRPRTGAARLGEARAPEGFRVHGLRPCRRRPCSYF
jgi:hypothetical protein